MEDWLRENWLAFYGAVVGSVALAVNFFKYRHTVARDAIRLRVSCEPHPQIEWAASVMRLPDEQGQGGGVSSAEAYRVTVVNDGAVTAHLFDVGITTTEGRERGATVIPFVPGSSHLISYPVADVDALVPAKSSRHYDVYFRRGDEPFEVATCYAVDRTGKRWESKVKDSRTRRALVEEVAKTRRGLAESGETT